MGDGHDRLDAARTERHRPELGTLVDEVSDFRGTLSATAQIGATGTSPLTPAELRLLPYLQTHLTIGEIGERGKEAARRILAELVGQADIQPAG